MLAPGQIARRALGRHFQPIGEVYRRVFVHLDRVADFLVDELPHGATILDIGGGDGALVNRLLDKRPDLTVTMCDLAPEIGAFLSDENRAKVKHLPATAFYDVAGSFDAVTICDVVHHVPADQREPFFRSLAESCRAWGCRRIILKDMEPRGWRAWLALFADRHITGDKHVVPFSRSDFARLARQYFPGAKRASTVPDWPNYGEVLSW